MGLYRIEYQIYSHSGNSETLIDSGCADLETDETHVNTKMRRLILDRAFGVGDDFSIKTRTVPAPHKIESCEVRIVSFSHLLGEEMSKRQVEAVTCARADNHPESWRHVMSSLTRSEQKIILELYENPPSSITAIAQRCFFYMPSLSGTIRNLKDLGLIGLIEEDREDKREIFYELQDQGLIDYLELNDRSRNIGKYKAVRDLAIAKKDLKKAMQSFIDKPLDEDLDATHDLIDRYKLLLEALK